MGVLKLYLVKQNLGNHILGEVVKMIKESVTERCCDRLKQKVIYVILILVTLSTVITAEEVCTSCGYSVSVSGNFNHFKTNTADIIEGDIGDNSAFYEEIYGKEFSVSVSNLPEGTYTVIIGFVEPVKKGPEQRVFDVISGDVILADDFDIFAAANGQRKVCYVSGDIYHTDDALKGPLKVDFKASKDHAKFNTFAVKDASGTVLVEFCASEIAPAFDGDAERVPAVNEDPIWRDPSYPLKDRIDDLISRMSLAEKVAQIQNDAPAIPRLGLNAYNYWNEALHGVANNGIATVFPEPVGMASTWNPELLRKEGTIIGIEGRAKYNEYANKNNGDSKWWTGLTYWTPNVNIFRDPRWGRGQETYGEDPYLVGEIAVQFIKGIQGDDPRYMLAMACAKHYAVHNGPERDRHRFNVEPSERDLYEMYLPQFERTVRDAQVAGVMSAYNALYGVPCSASTFLLDDLLRNQWGFEGYVVSDCSAINDIWNKRAHGYLDTPEDAAAAAVKAGCDLCCGGDYNALVKGVQIGLISGNQINRALYYTLWTRFKLGLFDPKDSVPYNKYTIADNDKPEHGQVALEIARQSMVLLKNDGILPLDISKNKKIAVIGPNSDSKSMLEGNYHGSASHPVSILNGIKQIVGNKAEIFYAMGSPITTKPGSAAWSRQDNETNRPIAELRDEAIEIANNSDIVIYVGGITPAQEGEGFDRESIELPDVQSKLIKAIYATGKPVVMVNCSGSAMALTWESENLPAILQAWYPGQEGGRAVAEVLFGLVNPSGHLPITFYAATSDLPDFRDYSFKNRTYRYFEGEPLYAFGHGLSYTDFQYSKATLASKKITTDGTIKVMFTMKNSGKLSGDDVVQIYYRHVNSNVPQPQKALCGFARVSLKAEESKQVAVEVPVSNLRYWDTVSKQYIVEPGKYEILIGKASDNICQALPLTITEK